MSAGAATATLCTTGGSAAASALHSMLRTAAVELPNVAWDGSSTDTQAVPLTSGALHADQPAPDVMGCHAEGGAWLSPVLCEEAMGAQEGTEGLSGALNRRNIIIHCISIVTMYAPLTGALWISLARPSRNINTILLLGLM